MHKIIRLPFCSLEIRNRIVIATIDADVHLTSELSEEMVLAVFNAIGDKPTVYLTNRINSYSVDPTLYTNISKVENIIGFGVISQLENKPNQTSIEKLFYKKNFQLFNNLEAAVVWANKTLETHKSKVFHSN